MVCCRGGDAEPSPARGEEGPGYPGGGGRGWGTDRLGEGRSLRGRQHVKPRAEPSDWVICRLGQRSGGRGRNSPAGRDWRLLGRHHCDVDEGS